MKTFYFLPVLFVSLWCKAQNGLYPYAVKSQWGLTNKNRAVLLEPQFDSIHPFEGDYARVESGKKVGLIHRTGKVVFSCSFNDIPYILSNGTAIGRVPAKGYVLLDAKAGKQLGSLVFEAFPHQAPVSPGENFLAVKKEGKVGIVNTATGELAGKKFAYDDVEFFYEAELKDKIIVSVEEKYGVADAATGNEILPVKYDEVEARYTAKHPFIRAVSGETISYFEISGKPLAKEFEKTARSEDEDYTAPKASVFEKETEGRTRDRDVYITKLGNDKWLLSLENRGFRKAQVLDSTEIKGYTALEYLSYNPAEKKFPTKIKAVKDNKAGIIDLKGKVIVPLIYDNVKYREDNIGRYACVETFLGGKVGVLRADDLTEMKKPVLKAVLDEDKARNALLVQVQSGEVGYMDKTTGEIFIPGYKE
ncbi:WG repeat-containing protein [Chitinophaga tropicalis]|uniref:WG repeat-containing protein n=1 Tax=Chitinophaga tropicalis TaxID=2683588 RepID=A0A7K1U861_9BACT|nr:WG repeat-containing protein [Chitinophaga tropicalis]MVT10567.1 hypothetical protein [Chitinophaga tropicalis]